MYPSEQLAIYFVIALVLVAAVWSLIVGPKGPFAPAWRNQARELEVKIKMGRGIDTVDDLRALCQLYVRLGKRWDGEQALQRALRICEYELGENNPATISVLKDYAKFLSAMHRRAEAKAMRKRMEGITPKQG